MGGWFGKIATVFTSKAKAAAVAKTAAVVGGSMCVGCFVGKVTPPVWPEKPVEQVAATVRTPAPAPIKRHHRVARATPVSHTDRTCGFGVPTTFGHALTPLVNVIPPPPNNPPPVGAPEASTALLFGAGLVGLAFL